MQEKWLSDSLVCNVGEQGTNKGEGKNQAGTLQGRRCRQRVQRGTHAGCGGFQRAGKTGEAPGAWQQREKERKRKRKRKRQLGQRIELGSAELNAQMNDVNAN